MSRSAPKETILSFNCFYYEVISCKKDNPMNASYHRHDISDETWNLLESHLPGRKGTWGGNARDNRQFINAVFWILRTGAPGAICHQIMATGRTPIGVSVDGETRESGKTP